MQTLKMTLNTVLQIHSKRIDENSDCIHDLLFSENWDEKEL